MRQQQIYPCGLNRREWLWEMGGGFTGTALTALLAQSGFFAQQALAAPAPNTNPLAHKEGHYPERPSRSSF
ncbi:MAG: hypothetical protein R3C11_22640 [Planctomycetaceae bacterium]